MCEEYCQQIQLQPVDVRIRSSDVMTAENYWKLPFNNWKRRLTRAGRWTSLSTKSSAPTNCTRNECASASYRSDLDVQWRLMKEDVWD